MYDKLTYSVIHLTLQIRCANALIYSFLSISLPFKILNEKNLSFSPENRHRIPNISVSPNNKNDCRLLFILSFN